MRRKTSTLASEAASVSPPACRIRSPMVVFSAYWYVPGKATSPLMVSVCSPFISSVLGTNSTSPLRRGTSAAVPFRIPSMSTDTISSERSSFRRCITARVRKASSRRPSAACNRPRTVCNSPPSWYCPSCITAPRTSTMFEKRATTLSTKMESPSMIEKADDWNSSTLCMLYSDPALRVRRTFLVYASPANPPANVRACFTLSPVFIS